MARTIERPPTTIISRPISSSRRELIEIQREIVEELKQEIEMSVGKATTESQVYLEEYAREFEQYQRLSNWGELIANVRKADIVYNGDYHTMAQAQRIPLRLLREIVPYHREVTLALEMVRIEHQKQLDSFMRGKLTEEKFLEAIDYDRTWGFPWEYYKDLFIFARERGVRVIGINSEPKKGRGVLKRRDRSAARVIAREHLANPERLIYVFDGDLHVAPTHLPAAVNALLAEFNGNIKSVIVYQNNEQIYWKLARLGIEQETDVVLISKGKFCVMSTPPVIKFQSYFNWIDNTRELTSPVTQTWRPDLAGEEDLYSQVLRLVRMIAEFLEIEVEGLADFVVYSPADLDFLDELKTDAQFTPAELAAISTHIRTNESYFIEKGSIIYIANLSINHAAEESAHFIHTVCAGPRRSDINMVEDFYCRVMREAVGFFGSKVVNHKRPCFGLNDFKYLKRRYPTKPPEQTTEMISIGKLVRKHKQWEKSYLSRGKPWKTEGPMYNLPLGIHIGVTHALGYMLGYRLFEGLMKGTIEKKTVRDLFFTNLSDLSQSLGIYLRSISSMSRSGRLR
ncbi:MAG: ChaN family lipoprotein [Candidatus Eisenbacteria bacterium]